ncbi:NEAT domain-containing protein [Sporosarcina beigongshangi]|uniref:NEAT domain-containing protein n=1 Tax=Sporosarcina beigongshangi TaxID=2782538 RepID=UPI001939D24D|nr:NEAT domain-containing protein [Sporosarcina beigongshangi]
MKKKMIGLVAILFTLLTLLPTFMPLKAVAASPYADGEYSVPFSVLKDTGSEPSATAEYVVSPAKLTVQNGKMHIIMTLNNSSWWQYFKVNGTDVQVISEDAANDKRVVRFEVKDLTQLVGAKIHIIVTGIPGFNYDNKYDIRFKFNVTNIPLAPVVEKPTPKPAESEKVTTTPSAKPADTKVEKKPEVTTKAEEKPVPSKEEVVSQKTEEPVVEKEQAPTEAVEPTESVDAEATVNKESAEEVELEVEEVPEVTAESAVEEVEAISTSNASLIWFIIVIAIVLASAVILFIRKRKS